MYPRRPSTWIFGSIVLLMLPGLGSAMYDPQMGRFCSRDPIAYEDNTNLFQYTKSSPMKSIDPGGEFSIEPLDWKLTELCGGFEFYVKWHVAKNEKKGWIVQHIIEEYDVYYCDDSRRDVRRDEFWEAWEVQDGKVHAGRVGFGPHNADGFAAPGYGTDSKGSIKFTGYVKFLPNYRLDARIWRVGGKGGVGGALPEIDKFPGPWDDATAQLHQATIEWTCCCGRRSSRLQVHPKEYNGRPVKRKTVVDPIRKR